MAEQLTARGYSEIMNNSLTAESHYAESEEFPAERCVRVMNPQRRSRGDAPDSPPSEVRVHSPQYQPQGSNLKFYEFGNVYSCNPEKEQTADRPLAPFSERFELALWLTGDYTPASWNAKGAQATVYDMRAAVDNIFRRLGVNPQELKVSQGSDGVFAARLDIATRSGRHVASLGLLTKALLRRFDIEQPVVYAEIDWKALFRMAVKRVTFTDIPRTQHVERTSPRW